MNKAEITKLESKLGTECIDSIFGMIDDQIQDSISFYIDSMEWELTDSQEREFRFQVIGKIIIELRRHYNITK